MYQIKQLPSDFLVKEISNIQPKPQGNYLYFCLKKRDYNTLDALKLLSQKLNLPLKNLGFAGSKDKQAITEQLISIKSINKNKVLNLKLRDIELKFFGYSDQPICLGDLTGNYFEIVIRNLDNFNIKIPKKIINYFDAQRFGSKNIEIGKNLLKKDFEKALQLINQKELDAYLEKKKNDFIGALKLLPIRLLKMYVNAYQSFLWNQTVKEIIKNKIKVKEAPLIGFATDLEEYPQKIQEIIHKILKKENLTLNDFLIRPIPQLSQEGSSRNLFVEPQDFKILEKNKDELNPGKKKLKVSFTLPKGSYATRVIKEMFA